MAVKLRPPCPVGRRRLLRFAPALALTPAPALLLTLRLALRPALRSALRRAPARRPALRLALALAMVATASQVFAARPLEGVIQDARTLLPVAHAIVELRETGETVQADAAGRFRFGSLPNGTYHLCVQRIGYRTRCDIGVRIDAEELPEPLIQLVSEPLQSEALNVTVPPRSATEKTGHTIITAEEIERSGAISVADVLDRTPEVEVVRSGTQSAHVSIRGSRPEAVRVVVDDVPLNADGGAVDLNSIPAHSIDRIEIVRGPSVTAAGTDALAGAVLITTKAVGPQFQAGGGAAAGSFGSRMGRVYADGIGIGTQRFAAAWEDRRTDGDFHYYDNQFKRDTIRHNNAAYHESANVRGRGSLPVGFAWSGGLNSYRVRAGVPGQEFALTPEARREQERWVASARLDRRSEAVAFGLTYAYTDDWNHFVNTGLRPYDWETRAQRHLAGATLGAQSGILTGLGIAGEYERERFSGVDHLNPAYSFGHADRVNYAALVHLDRSVPLRTGSLQSLRLNLAYRLDQTETAAEYPITPISPVIEPPERVFRFGSPHAAARLDGDVAGVGWNLQGSYGRAFRRPPLLQQFWDEAYRVRGNPGLRPERSEQLELGYGLRWSRSVHVEFEQRFYWSSYRDLIVWRIGAGQVATPYNLGRARIEGREESLRLGVIQGALTVRFAHLFQNHRNESGEPNTDGEPIPFRYRHKLTAGAGGRWHWGWIDLAYRWFDRRYMREAGRASKSLDPYGVVDVTLGLRGKLFGLVTEWIARLENLTDTRYELIERQPMPSRALMITLNLNTIP